MILAAVFLLGGLVCLIWPEATVVAHPSFGREGSGQDFIEAVSATGSRVYGVLAMLVGSAIAALVFGRRKE